MQTMLRQRIGSDANGTILGMDFMSERYCKYNKKSIEPEL